MAKESEGELKVTRSTCWGLGGCDAGGCAIKLYTKGGKLVKVEGDEEHPENRGRVCPRILGLKQYVYHPHRLKYPMKRVGKRGEGKWKRISWDEAYDIIVKKLNEIKEKYGSESVIFCQGTGRDIMCWMSRLTYSYGSPNWTQAFLSGQSCYIPRIAAATAVMGNYPEVDCAQWFPDTYDNPEWVPPKYMICWGKNPVYSNPDGFHGWWLIETMRRGTKLLAVIDPRFTWMASRAEHWLRIRPGTDAALALGMLNVIINEELYDKEFVEKWCIGFDKLKERVQEYPPEKVAEITGIPKEEIIEVARKYATNKPSAIMDGQAIDTQVGGFQAAMGLFGLMAVTGNIDVPGGNVLVSAPFGIYQLWTGGWGFGELITKEFDQEKRIGLKEYPLMLYGGFLFCSSDVAFGETVFTGKPYPIKGLWIQTTNFLACQGWNPKLHYETLKDVEFIVGVDLFMTPTMQFADVLLPAAALPEKNSINVIWDRVGPIVKVIDPPGECKSDPEICLEVGKRLNPEAWPWKNDIEMLDELLKPAGVTFEELKKKVYLYPPWSYKKHEKGLIRPDGKPGFNTASGKIELAVNFGGKWKEWGYDPLPYHTEPPESPISTPEVFKEYPLVLTSGGRIPVYTHSEYRQVPWLRECHPDPIVLINPDTAKGLGISDGEWVYIETKRGRCKMKAKLDPGMHPKVIHADHGWWFPEKPETEPDLFGVWESNINLCVQTANVCGVTGFSASYKSGLCKVYKAERGV